jgi:hypothetical protein
MASKKTVTMGNLQALGVEHLAGILIGLAQESVDIKRRLRLELAASEGGDIIAGEVGKRLAALRTARSFVDWQKRPALVKDLDLQRSLIVERISASRPDLALDLMWRFLDLAEPVLNRVDDSNGSVGDVFRGACKDLGTLALASCPDPEAFAKRVFTALQANDYGVYDHLVEVAFPALGDEGVRRLKARLADALAKRPAKDRERDWQADAFRRALQDIADGEGDIDEYIALVPAADRRRPHIAAAIARRLLAGGRLAEALTVLEAAKPQRPATHRRVAEEWEMLGHGGIDGDWETVYIETLEALGEREQAQAHRWAAFEERLSVDRLRAYLKALPDFEDVLAEDKAMVYALKFPWFLTALAFFHEWRDLSHAAELILARHGEIDGNAYYLLDSVAQWLEGKHPLAATLLRRAMIEDTLKGAKSSRYKHAARHLLECQSLAASLLGLHAQTLEIFDSIGLGELSYLSVFPEVVEAI